VQCINNLKQIGLGVYGYVMAKQRLPVGTYPVAPATTTPPVAGLTLLLPHLEEQVAYDRYDRTLSWDHATNRPVVSHRMTIFLCPSSPSDDRLDGSPDALPWSPTVATPTDYSPTTKVSDRLLVAGLVDAAGDGLLCRTGIPTFYECHDGLAYTILYAESAGRPYLYRRGHRLSDDLATVRVNGGGWARPASDFSVDGASKDGTTIPGPCAVNCTNGENVVPGGHPHPVYDRDGSSEVYAFHPGGANVVFADGSVRFVDEDIDIRQFARFVTRNGQELVTTDGLPQN
jgi:prepilin-type processing-associated H-X9-DG protein